MQIFQTWAKAGKFFQAVVEEFMALPLHLQVVVIIFGLAVLALLIAAWVAATKR